MVNEKEFKEIIEWEGEEGKYVVSLYLDVDGKKYPKREYLINLKSLIKERKEELEKKKFSEEEKSAIYNDLDKIFEYVNYDFARSGWKGLIVFACSEKKLFKSYFSPDPVRNLLIVNFEPYTKPLFALLKQYSHLGTVIVDGKRAKIYHIHMGAVKLLADIISEVPDKVRTAGWQGYEEKRIKAHIQDHLMRHLKNIALKVKELDSLYHFNYLVMGGRKDILAKFLPHLQTYLVEKSLGEVLLEINTPSEVVMQKTLELEANFRKKKLADTISTLQLEANKGGLAVINLTETLKAINQGAVKTLFVKEGLYRKGFICLNCGYLEDKENTCPICEQEMSHTEYLINELIEAAIQQDSDIEYIPEELYIDNRKLPEIGAFLRFKP